MIAHLVPQTLTILTLSEGQQGRDGPVSLPLRAPPGCQRPHLGAGAISRRARARRLRRSLLLSGAGPSRPRRRRKCATRRYRGGDCRLLALFGGARAVLVGALWHQRNAEDRRRGPRR